MDSEQNLPLRSSSTSKGSETQTSNSQGSATSVKVRKRYQQSQIAVQKGSQVATSGGLLLLNMRKDQVKDTYIPQESKESHSTNRKRQSRCSKSEKHLCSLPVNCGECINCL